MKQLLFAAILLGAGFAAGWWWGASDGDLSTDRPGNWIARIGETYIEPSEYVQAMRRRGGTRPGQYHDMAQKQELMTALLYRKAVARAAREEGLDEDPEIRRSLERILVDQYIARHLRPRQEDVDIPDDKIQAVYEREKDQYTVPARRRVAMIYIEVPESADESFREEARQRAAEAYEAASQLGDEVNHFGAVAREYSQDQSSRYRGGVIGWIGERAPERYRFDPAVIETANGMKEPGATAGIIEGNDGFYIVRLAEYQPERSRPLEELESGIRQRLLRDHYRAVEEGFREEMLARFETEVDEERLAAIEPLGPPAREEPRPPQSPGTGSTR